MQAEKIDLETAWQLTLLSREQWRPGAGHLILPVPGQSAQVIEIQSGGAWASELAVEPDAARLLDIMLPLCATDRESLVLAQMGQSLDGRIATPNGVSHYINGAGGLTHLHRLRALVDAVVVGAGTASADNPRLTVRHASGPDPVRVILDPNRRVPADHQIFQDKACPTLRLVSDGRNLSGPGVTDVGLAEEADADGMPVGAILEALAARGLKRVLVEGGGVTVSRFLQAGLIDHLHVMVAPMIIGPGRPAFTLPPMATLENALRPRTRVFDLGTDTLFDLQPRLSAH